MRWNVVFGLSVISAIPVVGAPADELNALADAYFDNMMQRYPMRATAMGDYRFNDRLDDLSEEGIRVWEAKLDALAKKVRRLASQPLSEQERLTRDLLERTIRDAKLRSQCLQHYMPLDPLDGYHIQLPLMLVSQPFRSLKDFEDYIVRLQAFPKLMGEMVQNMRLGSATGYVSPRLIIERVIPQVRVHIVSDATKSEFHKPVEKAGVLSEADRARITSEIRDAILADVVPAYLHLLAYIEDEALLQSRTTVGCSALPAGDKLYAALAYLHTTVRMTPDEIHELGLVEVARLRDEMNGVKNDVGFDGSLDDFLGHMRNNPAQRFNTGEELYKAADDFLQRTKPRLGELFGRLPQADCVMKRIESFRASSSPVAYYSPTPKDNSRPGYYYINTFSPGERLRFTLEALTYHEAVPGHHLQHALDQENKSLPRFRRYGGFTAYIEGWALYAEKLGYEIGGYTDPYQRFGQLNFEIWRACRLVVDTGLHAKGWPRKRAIDFMASNTSLALIDIEGEIDRYITWPGQALAYKIGELKILQLRKEAEETLGDRFDVRAFHDALLLGGAMPMDVLMTRMRGWIKANSG